MLSRFRPGYALLRHAAAAFLVATPLLISPRFKIFMLICRCYDARDGHYDTLYMLFCADAIIYAVIAAEFAIFAMAYSVIRMPDAMRHIRRVYFIDIFPPLSPFL